jgi:hypothetical protein
MTKVGKLLKTKAKKFGVRLTTGKGKTRKEKSKSVLESQVKRKSSIKRMTKKEADVCGRRLGSRGGRAKAGRRK